ncbi:MAG: energy transducer TonB [Ignavibacteriae bacterium]|nr:energy transducer TonB [Ignavibacteriota bacterium]
MKKGLILSILIFLTLNINATKTELNLYQSEEYLAFAEEMPTPLGGLEGIYQLIKYPELARKSNVQGKVYVLAFVNENGDVDDVKVVKGIGAGCDEETIEAVKKTKFSPGKSGGKNVKVKMSLQIQFKLT